MSSPCGKCNTCPCASQSNQPARPQEQVIRCQDAQPQQHQQEPPHTTSQQNKKPRVECLCSQKRPTTAPLQAPLADTYTCSRRSEPKPAVAHVPIEQRCTCKAKAAPPQCECAPPQVVAPFEPRQEPAPLTHAYINCGQPTPQHHHTHEHHRNYHNRPSCGHCNRPSCGGPPRCSQRAMVKCPDRQGCGQLSDFRYGTHRNMCPNRNRHCFVYRTPPVAKQRQRAVSRQVRCPSTDTESSCTRPMPALRRTCRQVHSSSTDASCCSPPPPPRNKCRQVRSVSSSDSFCPPPLQPQVACCCSVRQPMPEKPLCCVPRHRLFEQQRPHSPTESPLPMPTPYQSNRSDVQGQVDHFAPANQAINENIEEPYDPYYNYDRSQQNNSVPIADPMANFDLERFDRDNIGRNGGYGRRRNVSIRTCVDYDYEPGNQLPAQPYQRPHMPPSGPYPYSNQVGPQFEPTQQNRYLPPMEDDRNYEDLGAYKYIPCKRR